VLWLLLTARLYNLRITVLMFYIDIVPTETYSVERDESPKHFLVPTLINSLPLQEFVVSRVFSVVTVLLGPLMVEFTL